MESLRESRGCMKNGWLLVWKSNILPEWEKRLYLRWTCRMGREESNREMHELDRADGADVAYILFGL